MSWILRRAAVPVGLTAALVLAGTPALAATPWNPPLDLTANTPNATRALSAPMGYETSLGTEGGRARVVYETAQHSIEELVGSPGGGWLPKTVSATPDAASAPFGYQTHVPSAVARVVFTTTAGDIDEFNLTNSDDQWVGNDLTTLFGAPRAAGAPFGYTTDLGSGEVARVVYRMADGHIEELSLSPGGSWLPNDLTNIAGAPLAASDPVAYLTNLPGQGPVARVVYRAVDGTIEELSVQQGQQWQPANLSWIAGAPPAASAPIGFSSNPFIAPTFKDPVARVVYRTTSGNVEQLSVVAGGSWTPTNLSQNGAPPAVSAPFGYSTFLPSQPGRVARVVYQGTDGNIWDLKATDVNNWVPTQIGINPGKTSVPYGYETVLRDNDLTARVVYNARGHIHELSSTVG